MVTATDLAIFYQCKNGTKSINLAVKRNIDRFPNDFYFQLTEKEFLNLRFQTETSNINEHGGIRYLPYCFTEAGVAMLATVIKTSIAAEMSIKIMRAFVAMRQLIKDNREILMSLSNINDRLANYDNRLTNQENKIINHDKKISEYEDRFNELFSKFDKKQRLFQKGQVYDAYTEFINILESASEEVIIIDQYADRTILDLIRYISCNVIIITRNSERFSDTLAGKYNEQYHNLRVIRDNSFHDRYFIVDRAQIYHIGTSLNLAGTKSFMIIKIEDDNIKDVIIENATGLLK